MGEEIRMIEDKIDKLLQLSEGFRKPWEKDAAAYAEADSFDDVRKGFKRARKRQMFILSDKGVEKIKPKCTQCGKLITVKDGNRGEYFPQNKKIAIMHYYCAWDSIFKDLAKLADKLY